MMKKKNIIKKKDFLKIENFFEIKESSLIEVENLKIIQENIKIPILKNDENIFFLEKTKNKYSFFSTIIFNYIKKN